MTQFHHQLNDDDDDEKEKEDDDGDEDGDDGEDEDVDGELVSIAARVFANQSVHKVAFSFQMV